MSNESSNPSERDYSDEESTADEHSDEGSSEEGGGGDEEKEESNSPLFRLPVGIAKEVLKRMEICDLFSFSFCSKSVKTRVKSLNITTTCVRIVLSEGFSVCADIGNGLTFALQLTSREMREHRRLDRTLIRMDTVMWPTVLVIPDVAVHRWTPRKWKLRKWIDHFLSLFNKTKVSCFVLYPLSQKFDFNHLRDSLVGLHNNFWKIDRDIEDWYHRNLIERVYPWNSISMERNPNIPEVLLQKYLNRNSNITTFGKFFHGIGLDEMLLSNARFLNIRHQVPNVSVKNINRFLRSWVKGATPRLEFLLVQFFARQTVNQDTILKGIKYKEMPRERVQYVDSNDMDVEATVEGGYDIFRNNGTRATISITGGNQLRYVQMFVWI